MIGLIGCVLLISFCKKKKQDSTSTSPGYSYSGSYSLYQYYQVSNNQAVKTKRVPYVLVSKKENNQSEPIEIGSVYLNNIKLNITSDASSTKTNGDTISRNISPPFTWKVNGSREYPSFTEMYNDSLPRFFKYNVLPDSISRSGNAVIQLGGLHENGITVTIMSSTTGSGWQGSEAGGATTIAVNSPTMLATTSNATLTVSYFNTYVKTIEGKDIRFTYASNYDKIVKIIP
jgi:hypothetical protein